MRSILHKFVLAPVIMAAAALATNTAVAESARVTVPFSFTVAGKSLPAGTYFVERGGIGNLVTLKSGATAQSFSWIAGPGDPAPTSTAVTLKFVETGDTYALRTVQYGGIITSKLDKNPKPSEHAHTRIVTGD